MAWTAPEEDYWRARAETRKRIDGRCRSSNANLGRHRRYRAAHRQDRKADCRTGGIGGDAGDPDSHRSFDIAAEPPGFGRRASAVGFAVKRRTAGDSDTC